jgi:hypothetical protein
MFLEEQYKSKEINIDSVDLKHKITIILNGDIAWFEIKEFNLEHQKTFILLLKDSIEHFTNKGVKVIKQYVIEQDLGYFINSSIEKIDNDIYVVTTPLISFVDDMISVLGIKRL